MAKVALQLSSHFLEHLPENRKFTLEILPAPRANTAESAIAAMLDAEEDLVAIGKVLWSEMGLAATFDSIAIPAANWPATVHQLNGAIAVADVSTAQARQIAALPGVGQVRVLLG